MARHSVNTPEPHVLHHERVLSETAPAPSDLHTPDFHMCVRRTARTSWSVAPQVKGITSGMGAPVVLQDGYIL